MKSAAIVCKPNKQELYQLVPELKRWLEQRGYRVHLDREAAQYASAGEFVQRQEIGSLKPDFVVVLGGDGTMLSASRAVAAAGAPIIGVNLGSLGFLTEVTVEEMWNALEAVVRGGCPAEERSMLHCQLVRQGTCVASYEALNDAVVSKSSIARLGNFVLTVGGEFVSNYQADGLIVATPTGSTAYSLAAGGPILTPSVDAFVITPVSPHSLTHRPLVVRDSAEIEVEVRSAGEEAFLSIDGQTGMPLNEGDRVRCRRSQYVTRLLRPQRSFFDVLRTKLRLGQR